MAEIAGDGPGNREELARRIRTVRQSLGLSLQRLATAAEISPGYLSEVERGLSAISGEKLAKIAQQLGKSVDYLLTGREDSKAQTSVNIPAGLSDAAEELNLSYAETLRLLAGKESLVARRSGSAAVEWGKEQWVEFYKKVKPYL